MARYYFIIIIYLLFGFTSFAQGEVSATILIGNELDASLEIEFNRVNIDSSRLYVTSINIDNYVRHKEPTSLIEKTSNQVDIKNVLSGSWYSKENNDLIIGAYLGKGEKNKNIKINLPDPIYRDFESNKSIFIRKSDNEISKYLTNNYIVFKELKKVSISFKDKDLFKVEEVDKLEKKGIKEYELDFTKNSYGTIKYRPVSYFNGVDWIYILGLAILFAYIIFIALLNEKIGKVNLRISYFIIFITSSICAYYYQEKIDKTVWLMLFSVATSTLIVFVFSLTPDRIFRMPQSVMKTVKETKG